MNSRHERILNMYETLTGERKIIVVLNVKNVLCSPPFLYGEEDIENMDNLSILGDGKKSS